MDRNTGDPPHLWGAHLLQPDDPAFDLTLPGTFGARAIGVDHSAQQVWIHSPGGLTLVDADGNSVRAPGTGHRSTHLR